MVAPGRPRFGGSASSSWACMGLNDPLGVAKLPGRRPSDSIDLTNTGRGWKRGSRYRTSPSPNHPHAALADRLTSQQQQPAIGGLDDHRARHCTRATARCPVGCLSRCAARGLPKTRSFTGGARDGRDASGSTYRPHPRCRSSALRSVDLAHSEILATFGRRQAGTAPHDAPRRGCSRWGRPGRPEGSHARHRLSWRNRLDKAALDEIGDDLWRHVLDAEPWLAECWSRDTSLHVEGFEYPICV